MQSPRSILITGASSGIGAALALEYAAAGVTLHLTGRNGPRLEAVAASCIAAGATATTQILDVADRHAVAQWIEQVDAAQPLDLVIANAGISGGTFGRGESDDQAREIYAVNVDGVVNTVQPALACMVPRGAGQIAIMSSIASFLGISSAPAYCASKASVRVWGEGLRHAHRRDGIRLSVICPGFVRTPMTDVNKFPMPLIMSAEKAAGIVRHGLAADRARIAFPRRIYWLVRLMAGMPEWVLSKVNSKMPKKKGRRHPR